MTNSGGSSPLPSGNISRIDIVHKMNWYKWDEKCVGIGFAKVTFPLNFRGYAKTLSRDDADATYEKIMNAKLPERVKIGDDGLFVQTAGKFTFEIDKDEWAEEFLLFQKGQERKGYAQTIDFPEWAELLDAKHPLTKTKLCDDIPVKEHRYFDTNSAMCGPSAWSVQNVGSFAPAYLSPNDKTVIDYFYEDTDIDVSDYLCSVIDDSGNCVFSGFINSDGVEYTPETETIKISCTSLLITLSQASQKNSMIYYTPTSGGTEKLETNIKNIMMDVFRNVNRMFIGRDPGWVDHETEQFTQVRTMNGLLHPTFSGDFSEDIVTRQCTDESFDINAENFSSRPTNEQLANKGICVPQWPQDSGNYDIDQQEMSFEVFANKGSGGLFGITFVTHLKYWGRKNPGDYDEIFRRKDMVSVSHFRYRRGVLENSVFEVDNVSYMAGRPGIGVGIGAIAGTAWPGSVVSYAPLYDYLSNVDNILLGLDKSTKIQVFAKKIWENDNNTNIADPACGFMGAEFTVVEVGTSEEPKCFYKINVQKKRYIEYVVNMPILHDNSEYYQMRPHVNIFDINITFTGNDYVEQYMFNTAGSKPRVMRIGEMLKVILYMANIRIEQDVEKAVISKRDIKITDSTEILKISDSDLIDPNIGQNKIELPTVDLAIVLESDVGAGGDENGVDGINSYSRMLNEKYSSLSIETKNKIASKVSTLFNIYNLQPGGILNILNRLYVTNSILDDFSLHEIKTMSVNAVPVINITSFEESGNIAKFEWTNNNVAASFDVSLIISKLPISTDTNEDLPHEVLYEISGIKNTGRFICDISEYSGRLYFTVRIDEINYEKTMKFKNVWVDLYQPTDGDVLTSSTGLNITTKWNLYGCTIADVPKLDIYFRKVLNYEQDPGSPRIKIISGVPNNGECSFNSVLLSSKDCIGLGYFGVMVSGVGEIFSERRVLTKIGEIASSVSAYLEYTGNITIGETQIKILWNVSGGLEGRPTDILLLNENDEVEHEIMLARPHQFHVDDQGFSIAYPDSILWVPQGQIVAGIKKIKVLITGTTMSYGITSPFTLLAGSSPSQSISITRPHVGEMAIYTDAVVTENWTSLNVDNVDIGIVKNSVANSEIVFAQDVPSDGNHTFTLGNDADAISETLSEYTSLFIRSSSNHSIIDMVPVKFAVCFVDITNIIADQNLSITIGQEMTFTWIATGKLTPFSIDIKVPNGGPIWNLAYVTEEEAAMGTKTVTIIAGHNGNNDAALVGSGIRNLVVSYYQEYSSISVNLTIHT